MPESPPEDGASAGSQKGHEPIATTPGAPSAFETALTGKYRPVSHEEESPVGLPPGQRSVTQIIPDYDLVGELGRGGMGIVYKAWNTRSKRFVALKMVLPSQGNTENQRKQFLAEVEAVAHLRHPHIVQILDFGNADGHLFLSLEFCGGGNLAKKIGGRPMPPRDAACLIEKIALAVDAAHQRQIIHRDLKPANILLMPDGEPKISDFGIAHRLDRSADQSATTFSGTPSYMSPEQILGSLDGLSRKVDVYALGAIFYECLTGRPPFIGSNESETLSLALELQPVPPGRLNPFVPEELDRIVLHCLAKKMEERYDNAAAIAVDIRAWLDDRPISIPKVTEFGQFVTGLRQHPYWLACASLAVLVLIAVALLLAKYV